MQIAQTSPSATTATSPRAAARPSCPSTSPATDKQMLFYIIGIALSIPRIVHVIKTGPNTVWVIVLLAFPLIGSAVYFFVEVFPELKSSRTSQRAMRGLKATLDPEG